MASPPPFVFVLALPNSSIERVSRDGNPYFYMARYIPVSHQQLVLFLIKIILTENLLRILNALVDYLKNTLKKVRLSSEPPSFTLPEQRRISSILIAAHHVFLALKKV